VLGNYTRDLMPGSQPYLDTHTVAALFWFCLPVALVGTLIIRRAAPIVAAHLPDLGTWHLRDYGVLGTAKYRWWVTVLCVLFGALTHIFWDSFTHPRASFWSTRFDHTAFAGLPWWAVFQYASTIGGAIAVVLMAHRIGRRRMLLLGDRVIVEQPAHPYAFWSATIAVWLTGLGAQPFLVDGRHNTAVLGVRLLVVIALGFLAGAVAGRCAALRTVPPGTPPRRRDLRQRVPGS
jgi:hypothetical protein